MNRKKTRERQKERGGFAHRAVLAAAVTAGVLALVYFAGAFFFAGHYFWKTQIDGKDVSFRSKERIRKEFLNPEVSYKLVMTGREGMRDELTPDEVGMSYAFDDTLDRFSAEMRGWKWPSMFFSSNSCELPKAVRYNEAALRERLLSSPFFDPRNIRRPVDARISGYEENAGYSIIPEDSGTVLDFEKVMAAGEEALRTLSGSLALEEGDFYSDAAVKADDPVLNRLLETANRYVNAEIVYRWNGQTEVVDGGLISGWIEIGKEEVYLDEGAVREYVNGLARVHDTFGKDRSFTASDGSVRQLKGGSYGWWTNRAGETEALIEAIRNGERLEKEPLYFARGYAEGPAGEDIGRSYVEIDLGRQHLYLYIDGKKILESDLVSGSLSRGYSTPAGVFGLTYKERNATLT